MDLHCKRLATNVVLCLVALFLMLLTAATGARAASGAYNVELSPELNSAKDLCALVPCTDVFPGARSFSERMGQPPYVEAYGEPEAGKKKLLGYVMLSTDITDTPAYSGKPVVTLIGIDLTGHFVGVKVLKHSEPILLLGIPESALLNFNNQYIGKSVADKIEVGQSRPDEGVLGVDAISGATVTVIAQNQVMMTSGTAVARQVGILAPTMRESARFAATGQRLSWEQLIKQGSVQRLLVKPEQVGLARGPEPFIELWFGDLNHPDVGASVLGNNSWNNLRLQLKEGESALFVVRTAGNESFKGSGFVRGGIYDRIQVRQGADLFTFRDTDYLNLYGLEAAGAPSFTESGIFIIRTKSFSAAHPWELSFLGNRVDAATGKRSFTSFSTKYWLAPELLQGGRPVIVEPDAPWVQVWKSRAVGIVFFALLLIAVTVVYAFREKLTRRSTHKNKWPVNAFKYSAWALSIGFVGFGVMAQPSITQVLTWLHALLFNWTWSLFLSDPFLFLFWIFIILTVFLFGRGLFCGWLCPFGSLSEAIYKIGGLIGLKRFQGQLPRVWHDRLKWLKYAIFFGLLTVSMFSMGLAEILSEVEPFKTTFLVGISNRAWPYGLFVCAILGLSLFIERPYCKYICPLGAALAMPSTFRWFGLKRKQDCNSCKACAVGCGAQAIDADGRIDHRECLHCLDCMVLYTDVKGCPPLAKERKRRERDGLEITPIGRDGYFIPIRLVTDGVTSQISSKAANGPDPRMPTDSVARPYKAQASGLKSLWLELVDHLWPWTAQGWKSQRALQIAGFSLALAATVAWALAATGRLSASAIIGWWIGWSVYEVLIRLSGRRYVKDGPWWQAHYRYASIMDMLSYVGFKNLLIGAALFLALKALGLLVI
ncbi:MAG: NosR/NirI family protein [Gammaproteobacteria bacterium]|uniref:NosR/NirI family protein n=1 Tax=Rhodoferax sp. TaxID=50421 RepID=UPI0017D2517C|nr:NosR/NirI family protein [Rhodoferax sp.]MBU3898800.1 NosR/NirI family protein [Gammaproteobacteria bacterium]MBA3057360.1 regulatory protein NosR [Rhodoferax sp.]MBU3998991.1 NosR/NirI family protein [Gammaproteobacteria bacterium]MBU4019276.1 NosR/NirI family protein [Gammaproteobacteria bacterium]MBU4081840.1 NosR/NirI family protein [Gammaproteobacteria bacterium]